MLRDPSGATQLVPRHLGGSGDKRGLEAVRVDRLGLLACPSIDESAGELPCVYCRCPSVPTVSKILSRLMTRVVCAPLFHVRSGLEPSPLWPCSIAPHTAPHERQSQLAW